MIINLHNVDTKDDLQRLLKDKLDFPEYYGMNWSAFWDAITGLIELPETITFESWYEFEKKLPEESKVLLGLFKDYNTAHPEWRCEITLKE